MSRQATNKTPLRLSWAAAATAAAAGAWTVMDPGLLQGPPAMVGSARGTALVVLVVGLPTMVIASRATLAGSARAVFGWMGSLLYLVYNALLFLFLTPFNSAFLVYVAMLGTSLWAVAALGLAMDPVALARRFSVHTPVRSVAVYTWAVAVLNAAAWLAVVVPALVGPFPPGFLQGTGVTTNAIYVQDLGVWLPLAAVAAWWLWRRQPRGLAVVPSLLAFWAMESVSIAVDQSWGARLDPESTVVSASLVVPFLVLAVVNLVPLVLVLRHHDVDSSGETLRTRGPWSRGPIDVVGTLVSSDEERHERQSSRR